MSQTQKLKDLLSDTEPHNTLEIRSVVYGNEILNMARIAARVQDLKDKGYVIKGWKENGMYWYQMETAKTYELPNHKPTDIPKMLNEMDRLRNKYPEIFQTKKPVAPRLF